MMKTIVLATLLTSATLHAASGELLATARKLSTDRRDAVVGLSVISKTTLSADGDAAAQVKAQLSGQDKEEKSETVGTIVDADGLILVALATIDKSSVVDGKSINIGGTTVKLKASCEFKEIKVIMPDGTEIPADLVLKDNDLGIGVVRVRKDSKEAEGVTFTAIDASVSAQGELLDECILLGRLGENMNREASAATSEITGITTKPRKFYRVPGDSAGCPVFLSDGRLLGFSTMRAPSGQLSGGAVSMTPLVLPADDIVKFVRQAKNVPAVEGAK